ncbi:hypothetical protein K443DRAFT_682308 [Laccaria amethystina LaAM-08-1]|uniref:Uncharacterized protein n=1 Tax=Laccaria amethystina LaAM-08-1 TaxID=1095629 RepID=A0A0C9X5J8_9AGAR|nr:hypothetical protein K443DRAFT_685392 [Laccaria amethystina LaAM-08-1]KIJ93096.1 hypothetical protein K443DRAFT_684786 [Laccaria amethystina LaAM-08-1]KIJ96518.1 hypothetical protein K443DRAFT_682308 [Laccaria amethystina LaAM-08-1]
MTLQDFLPKLMRELNRYFRPIQKDAMIGNMKGHPNFHISLAHLSQVKKRQLQQCDQNEGKCWLR